MGIEQHYFLSLPPKLLQHKASVETRFANPSTECHSEPSGNHRRRWIGSFHERS